jgi:hypothetical protein
MAIFCWRQADEKAHRIRKIHLLRIRSTTCQLQEWQTLANKELSRRKKPSIAGKQTAEGIALSRCILKPILIIWK